MKHDITNLRNAVKDFNRRLAIGAYDVYLRYIFLTVSALFIGGSLWKILF